MRAPAATRFQVGGLGDRPTRRPRDDDERPGRIRRCPAGPQPQKKKKKKKNTNRHNQQRASVPAPRFAVSADGHQGLPSPRRTQGSAGAEARDPSAGVGHDDIVAQLPSVIARRRPRSRHFVVPGREASDRGTPLVPPAVLVIRRTPHPASLLATEAGHPAAESSRERNSRRAPARARLVVERARDVAERMCRIGRNSSTRMVAARAAPGGAKVDLQTPLSPTAASARRQ